MKRILCGLILLLLLNIVYAEENRIYEVNLKYDNGLITLNNVIVKPGFTKESNLGNYQIELIDKEDNLIYLSNFEVPTTIIEDKFTETGLKGNIVNLEKTDFILTVPYNKEGDKIIIVDANNNEMLRADVSYFNIKEKKSIFKRLIENISNFFSKIF